MRISICAVGRMRSGPEHELVTDYVQRFERSGRALGLGPARIIEVEDKKSGGMRAEAVLLERVIAPGAALMALDERGDQLSSPQFANMLAGWREQGQQELAVIIGGADGLDPSLRDRADRVLSFGPMVWPHMMVRAMLAEQLYRAASILAGAPYHRA